MPVPIVTAVIDSYGPIAGGNTVIIYGSGFTGADAVTFNSSASFSINSDTQITATAPAAGSPGPIYITVTNGSGSSAATAYAVYYYTIVPPSTDELFQAPDPNASWLTFRNVIRVESDAGVAIHKPLGAGEAGLPSAGIVDDNGFFPPFSQGDIPPDIMQYPGAASTYIRMFGECIRANYAVTPPAMTSVGGVTPQLIKAIFQTELFSWQGIPMVFATWDFLYYLPSQPTQNIGPPPNPLIPNIASTVGTNDMDGGTIEGTPTIS
jgi:IPT/TIG domain